MSVNEKMTALADEIRELSGTTDTKSLDEMKVDVDAANAEIAEQAALIAQITTALEGKAGGLETYAVTITATNSDLSAVISFDVYGYVYNPTTKQMQGCLYLTLSENEPTTLYVVRNTYLIVVGASEAVVSFDREGAYWEPLDQAGEIYSLETDGDVNVLMHWR